eukprot:1184274-Pyramimonas_sp.AAC.1
MPRKSAGTYAPLARWQVMLLEATCPPAPTLPGVDWARRAAGIVHCMARLQEAKFHVLARDGRSPLPMPLRPADWGAPGIGASDHAEV